MNRTLHGSPTVANLGDDNGDDGVTRLIVEVCASGHNPWVASDWRARVRLADATVHEFANPFDLARFLARPIVAPPRRNPRPRVALTSPIE